MAAFNYRSLAWRSASAECLRSRAYRCEACGRDCSREPGRIVAHHALGARRFPAFALDQQFLAALCVGCHDAAERCIHFRRLGELVAIGLKPEAAAPYTRFGPVPWQLDLELAAAANDETFTLDVPIEVPAD